MDLQWDTLEHSLQYTQFSAFKEVKRAAWA